MVSNFWVHFIYLNFDREYNGLLEAMQDLRLQKGSIITLNQSDTFEKDGMIIEMIPALQSRPHKMVRILVETY